MGIEVTTRILERLWAILEGGEKTPPLVLVGNRVNYTRSTGWLKNAMSKAPRDFPQLEIEVGVRGSHSAYTKDQTFSDEGPVKWREAEYGEPYDKVVERTEQVRITAKTDQVKTGGINPVKEAVVDDLMDAGGELGLVPPFLSCTFSGFTHEQRWLRRGDNPQAGQQTVINFLVTVQQGYRALNR